MSEQAENSETRSPQLLQMLNKALPWNADEGIRWDFFDEIGINVSLTDEDIEWLGHRGLTSKDEHTRELSATLLGLGHLEHISPEIQATLEHMALHKTDFDTFPPARFRAAVALWEHGDKRPELRLILEEVSRSEWKDVEKHNAERMAIAAEAYLQDIPRRPL